jgi:hypothetical protein
VSAADAADAPDPGRYVVLGAAGTDPASPLAACLAPRGLAGAVAAAPSTP